MIPSNSRFEEPRTVDLANAAEFIIRIDIDYIPAAYIGRLITNLGQLYQEVTGDIMLFCEATQGSLVLRFKAFASDKLASFIAILQGIFHHYDKEKIAEIAKKNLDALANRLPNEDEASLTARMKQLAEIKDMETKTQLQIISGLPKFASDMLDLTLKINPNAGPEKREQVASEAMRFYAEALGLGAQHTLSIFSGQENLQQVDNLMDRFKLEFRREGDDD